MDGIIALNFKLFRELPSKWHIFIRTKYNTVGPMAKNSHFLEKQSNGCYNVGNLLFFGHSFRCDRMVTSKYTTNTVLHSSNVGSFQCLFFSTIKAVSLKIFTSIHCGPIMKVNHRIKLPFHWIDVKVIFNIPKTLFQPIFPALVRFFYSCCCFSHQ